MGWLFVSLWLVGFVFGPAICVPARFALWGYGATVARLTPDQQVGTSNLSVLILCLGELDANPAHARLRCMQNPEVGLEPTISSLGGRRLIH